MLISSITIHSFDILVCMYTLLIYLFAKEIKILLRIYPKKGIRFKEFGVNRFLLMSIFCLPKVCTLKNECSIRFCMDADLVEQHRFRPGCNFPRNFSGTWYEGGDLDSDVTINATHVYHRTKLNQYNFRERYFTCIQNKDTRYLLGEVTVGKW